MKNKFVKLIGRAFAPVALVVAMAAFSPVTVLAASHGGGHGFSGGHAGIGGGHAFAAPSRGNFSGGRAYYGGRGYYGVRGYYGPGFGFGVGVYAPYGYAAPVCNPAGSYDANGVWQYYPGCAIPYGY